MKNLIPMKLIPVYKDYIWGGTKLKTEYGKKTDISPVAESWELSCHKDGLSTICGGEFDGKTLASVIEKNPEILGTYCKGNELPILIKFIDAADDLSVQVHPNDQQAKAWENQNGKTEMWYVVDADEGSKITFGVTEDIDKTRLEKEIQNKSVENVLNSVSSKKGDVFFVEAGTIHAIGKGNIIAEIQQNSNVTYRLYDYGRKGKDGKERELHIEKGVKSANCKKTTAKNIPHCSDGTRLLGSCEYFAVKEIKLNGNKTFTADEKSYHALVVTEGKTELLCDDYKEELSVGQTVFIPANMGEYKLSGNAIILQTGNQPRYYVSIDLSVTNIAAAVVDDYDVIYGSATTKTTTSERYDEILDAMAACAKNATKESGLNFETDIEAVGITCSDTVNADNRAVEFSSKSGVYDIHIIEGMQRVLSKKIIELPFNVPKV